GRDAGTEFRDDTERRDPSNSTARVFREPQVPVGTRRDTDWLSDIGWVRRDTGTEFSDDSSRGDPSNLVPSFGEPQVAIRPGCDCRWLSAGGDTSAEFGDDLGLRGAAEERDCRQP